MLLAALSIVLAPPQDLSKKISFTSEAKPAKRMLADLSGSAGITLTTSQVLDNETLVLHLDQAPLSEAMKRIATVVGGSWQKERDGYRLIRTATQAREMQEAELAERAAWIKKSIDEQVAKTEAGPLTAQKAEQVARDLTLLHTKGQEEAFSQQSTATTSRLEKSTDTARLFKKLLPLLNPREIAALSPGSRTVFSTSPNPMQRPLKGDFADAFRAFERDRALWSEAVKKVRDELGNPTSGYSNSLQFSSASKPGKVLLVVTDLSYGDQVSVEMEIADPEGRLIGEQMTGLYNGLDPFAPRAASEGKAGEKPIPISEHSRLLVDYMRAIRGGKPPLATPELKRRLLEPEQHDPLSLVVSDLLVGWAQAKNKSLVACVPDELTSLVNLYISRQDVTPSIFEAQAPAYRAVKLQEEDGWIHVRPVRPVRSALLRVSRPALGEFFRVVDAKGQVLLDDEAKFALSLKSTDNGYGPLARLFAPALGNAQFAGETNVVRLYGLLAQTQRKVLHEGGVLAYASLTPAQRTQVAQILYGRNSGLSLKLGPDMRLPGNRFPNNMWEHTELMPDGLPPDGLLIVNTNMQPAIRTFKSPADKIGRIETPETIAWNIVGPLLSDPATEVPYESFQVGKQTQITFTFQPLSYMEAVKNLRESIVDSNQRRLTFDQLPAEVRKLIDEQVAVNKKAIEDMKQGQRPVRKPPPN
jgi:hypothetical protein